MAGAAEAIAREAQCKVSTIDEVLADKTIDAVIICTPTNTHADLIERFARDKTLLEPGGLRLQFGVRQFRNFCFQRIDGADNRRVLPQQSFVAAAEDLLE